MSHIRAWAACAFLIFAFSTSATPLVTGNGFGYAVIQTNGALTKYYAHPYKFQRQNPDNVEGDGVLTANFVKSMRWKVNDGKVGRGLNVQYVNQSHVVYISDN